MIIEVDHFDSQYNPIEREVMNSLYANVPRLTTVFSTKKTAEFTKERSKDYVEVRTSDSHGLVEGELIRVYETVGDNNINNHEGDVYTTAYPHNLIAGDRLGEYNVVEKINSTQFRLDEETEEIYTVPIDSFNGSFSVFEIARRSFKYTPHFQDFQAFSVQGNYLSKHRIYFLFSEQELQNKIKLEMEELEDGIKKPFIAVLPYLEGEANRSSRSTSDLSNENKGAEEQIEQYFISGFNVDLIFPVTDLVKKASLAMQLKNLGLKIVMGALNNFSSTVSAGGQEVTLVCNGWSFVDIENDVYLRLRCDYNYKYAVGSDNIPEYTVVPLGEINYDFN